MIAISPDLVAKQGEHLLDSIPSNFIHYLSASNFIHYLYSSYSLTIHPPQLFPSHSLHVPRRRSSSTSSLHLLPTMATSPQQVLRTLEKAHHHLKQVPLCAQEEGHRGVKLAGFLVFFLSLTNCSRHELHARQGLPSCQSALQAGRHDRGATGDDAEE